MDPFTLAAILSTVGSVGTGLIAGKGQKDANQQNIQLAKDQMTFQRKQADIGMDFSERMSSTAIQRAVADYKAAGLNPALAYGHGGASSPGGMMGGGATATVSNVAERAISSARDTAAFMQNMKNLKAQERLTASQTALADATNMREMSQVGLNSATTRQAEANTREIERMMAFNARNEPSSQRLLAAEAMLRAHQANLAGLQIPGAKNTADFESLLGMMKPGIASAKTLSEILKLFRR